MEDWMLLGRFVLSVNLSFILWVFHNVFPFLCNELPISPWTSYSFLSGHWNVMSGISWWALSHEGNSRAGHRMELVIIIPVLLSCGIHLFFFQQYLLLHGYISLIANILWRARELWWRGQVFGNCLSFLSFLNFFSSLGYLLVVNSGFFFLVLIFACKKVL